MNNDTITIHNSMDFFNEKAMTARITPERIEHLRPGQIFVFGSNLQGQHAGGAAAIAHARFGAVWIPTEAWSGQTSTSIATFRTAFPASSRSSATP